MKMLKKKKEKKILLKQEKCGINIWENNGLKMVFYLKMFNKKQIKLFHLVHLQK